MKHFLGPVCDIRPDPSFSKFLFPRPPFFKENPLPKPYILKSAWHTSTRKKKKLSAPGPGVFHTQKTNNSLKWCHHQQCRLNYPRARTSRPLCIIKFTISTKIALKHLQVTPKTQANHVFNKVNHNRHTH